MNHNGYILESIIVDRRRRQANIVDRVPGRDMLCLYSNEADVLMKRICRSTKLKKPIRICRNSPQSDPILLSTIDISCWQQPGRNLEAQGGVE
jgi:hypothetical protein